MSREKYTLSTGCLCSSLFLFYTSAKRKPNIFIIYGVTLEVISLKLETYN